MLKDHFQKSTNTLNNLRSQHFKVSEYLAKGRYRMKQKFFGKGKKHYDFDLNSQEFFHEYIDDIIFEPTQNQEIFYSQLFKSLEHPIKFKNKIKPKSETVQIRKNPSQVRVMLARHFRNRANDLKYKKYLTMLRFHNLRDQQHITAIRSRTNLIQKQIQQALSRQTRLQSEDYFQASYIQGGKPIPVNENGQPIYKYLDEEQCWFSNISREDIQVFLRSTLYMDQVLNARYWPYWYQFKYLIFSQGLEICRSVQRQILNDTLSKKNKFLAKAKVLVDIMQKGIEDLSPGNLQEKQLLTTFVFGITGVSNENPIQIPIYPGVFFELLDNYKKATKFFFKNLKVQAHKDIIDLLPKLNSFSSILFKYQNQQILQGEKQIRLGLDDDIDIQKQLITMLEEQWVTKYIKIDYKRFQYKMMLKPIDWAMDRYSQKFQHQQRLEKDNSYVADFGLEEMIRLIRMTVYNDFRKILRRKSEKVTQRVKTKYEHMELSQKYGQKSDEELNMEKLSELYSVKTSQLSQLFKISLMKESTRKYFDIIIKDHLISNPVQVEIYQTLTSIKIRQIRTKVLNILNSIRCYHRNINLDLRVIDGCDFKFELDDNFLINSNKQTIQRFEKTIKQNQTSMGSRVNSLIPTIDGEDFLVQGQVNNPMLYFKDKVLRNNFNEEIPHLLVVDGKKKKNVLYDVALDDLKLVEERILQIGTTYINKYQRVIKMKQFPELADRLNVLLQLFELEESYLYEKFNLIQSYYYLYENTTQPLNAHKIGKMLVQIIYSKPKIDQLSNYFRASYQTQINSIREQVKIVKLFTKILQEEEKQKNKIFHEKFAKMRQIPLSLWAYVYGDMDVKGVKTYNKLQRMSSVSSRISKASKDDKEKNTLNDLKQQIRQQFGQDSQGEQQQQQWNLEQYDEYMLKRNMDDIFEDIIGGENQKEGKQKDGLGISSLGIENFTVNPKFEGGPHVLHKYLPNINLTSNQSQKLLDFSQSVCWVSNIHKLIHDLWQQGKQRYGFVSQEYQSYLKKHICSMMHKILLTPLEKLQNFHQFQTDDFYHETVTLDSKFFEEIMHPILDPPSALQLSIQATHEKHQNSLPSLQKLLKYDINILTNLIRYEKPVNSSVYRQLNLSINLVEFVRIKERMWHIQLEREQIYKAYRNLATFCDIPIEKYAHCYSRTGQSETFSACSEIKMFTGIFLKRPSFNESIQQLRIFYQLQESELSLFRSNVEIAKQQMQDYIRLEWDIQKTNRNQIINRNDILLSTTDKKSLKMLTNRAKGFVSSIGSEIFKSKSYLKKKSKIKSILEQKLKFVNETDFDQLVLKYFLNNDSKKYNKNCQTILVEKLKRNITRQYIKNYTIDVKQSTANNEIFLEVIKSVSKIKNYVNSLPYLSKIFVIPTAFQAVFKKVFYDQKKMKIVDFVESGSESFYYIQSKQQLIDQYEASPQFISTNNIENSINIQAFIKTLLPPSSKDQLFRWMFKIPANSIDDKQKESIKHMLRVYQPFTGRISLSEYRVNQNEAGSRNKFSTLYQKYSTIIEYLETNLISISIQVDSDINTSMMSIIKHQQIFEQKYPLVDEAAIYQKITQSNSEVNYMKNSNMAPLFVFNNRKQEFQQKLKKKIEDKNYSQSKQHWAVLDEILDFLNAKVQGYGIMRHCMLQLKDQLKLLEKLKSENIMQYMKSKTRNTFIILWLSLWGIIKTIKNEQIYQNVQLLINGILQTPRPQIFQTELSSNLRRGISESIISNMEEKQQQKLRFQSGIYNLKSNVMVNKLKVLYNFIPVNLVDYMESFIQKSEGKERSGDQAYRHNWDFFNQYVSVILKTDKNVRFDIFSKMRELFQASRKFLQTKIDGMDNIKLLECEEKKTTYLQNEMQGKIYMISLTAFKLARFSHSFPDKRIDLLKLFNKTQQSNIESIQINTFNIYDQFDAYKQSGKIIFSKSQQSIIFVNRKLEKESVGEYNNKLVRSVIFHKLAFEQLKYQIFSTVIQLLKAEKLPKTQGKKIQNNSLIPRVHLISSFSSPLIIQRKTYISQQYKLAFVQAFINRFRNKVSRVDLLSSGYGFVITVPDLEDCVNYMNKLLFTFTEKQFRVRVETFSQLYEILIEGIRTRNETIHQQNTIIKHLQDKVKNTLQAEYLAKVSKLLQEKVVIQQKMRLAQQASNGLEHRVRKTIQHQYDGKIKGLQKQNEELKNKFQQFKDLLIKLTKDTTKNNFLSLVNILKNQVSLTLDKKIDLSQSFKAIEQSALNYQNDKTAAKQIVKQQESLKVRKEREQREEQKVYDQQDIQKCKIGEDIIHDPYYVTKLINKMRVFNLFKMGAKKLKFEAKEQKKLSQLTALHKIQDKVIVQTQREVVLRNQLIRAHEQLSKKSVQLDKVKNQVQSLENEKAKLKILLVTKQKKIEQKQRQNQQMKKKYDERSDSGKIQSKHNSISEGQERNLAQDQLPKISVLRQQKKSKRNIDRSAFLTNLEQKSPALSLYEKFQLSNKDSTWRQKCEQLYIENKKLLNELDKLREGVSGTNTPYTRQGHSLNLRSKKTAQQSERETSRTDKRKFGNISFKYGVMKG